MTVSYNLCVSTSSPWSLFKLLFRWKGSLWKSIYIELLFWLIMYGLISVLYRYCFSVELRSLFEKVANWADNRLHLNYIPLNFMLGFFVSVVVKRWGILFTNIGLIENLALLISGYVRGKSENDRITRRNIVRYCVLAQVLVYRDISVQVRNRFPTLDTVVAAGFMLPHEKDKFEELQNGYGKSWMPFQWAISLLRKARDEKMISHDVLFAECVEQIRLFRTNLAVLANYDWVPIPIMYPQLVFLAVHTYFFIALFARQAIFEKESDYDVGIDVFSPIMSALQFIFYMGWMKVAEALLNPFGEDDDDFECNFLIDKNITTGLAIVDQCYDDSPESKKDIFWSEPVEPLYSEKSAGRRVNPLIGSAAGLELPSNVQEITMVPREDSENPRIGEFPKRSVVEVKRNSNQASRTSFSSSKFVNSIRRRFSRSNSGKANSVRRLNSMHEYENHVDISDEALSNYKEKPAVPKIQRSTILEDNESASFESIDIDGDSKMHVAHY